MTGKTFTQQDLTLGTVILQNMPLDAMLSFEKQFLIEDKAILSSLLAFIFTQVSDIRDALQPVHIWSSESETVDRFAENEEIDAVELILEIKLEGLLPRIRPVLRFMNGVFQNKPRVTKEWTIKSWTDSELTEDFDRLFQESAVAFTLSDVLTSSFASKFALTLEKFREKLDHLEMIQLEVIRPYEYEITIGNGDFSYTTRFSAN